MAIKKTLSIAIAIVGMLSTPAVFAQDADTSTANTDVTVDVESVGLGDGSDAMIAFAAPVAPMGAFGSTVAFGGGMGCPIGSLNLTDEQYEKVFEIKRDTMAKMASKMGDLMAAEMNIGDLMLQPALDSAKIHAAQDKINGLKSDMANARLAEKIAVMSVLTPEQRKELRTRMIKGIAGGGCPMMGMGMGGSRMMMHRKHSHGSGSHGVCPAH